jgi:nitrogen regulatory protein P-II 1
LVVQDAQLEDAIKAIQEAAHTGEIGDGKIFVYSVFDVVRIRTNERGDIAL